MRRLLVLGVVLVLARWLMVAGTGAPVAAPVEVPPGTGYLTLTAAPHGGWTQIQDPKAYYDANTDRTYLTWLNGSDGGVYIQAWDHGDAALVGSPFLIFDPGAPNNHNSPAVMVREDGRILVAESGHSTASMRLRISTNPGDVTAFGASVNLDSQLGGNRYTYPVLYQLRGVANDPIYLFYRELSSVISNTGRLAYSVSTDGGATWSAQTLLFTGANDRAPYWRIGSDWNTRIDIFTTDREPATSTGVWHFYLDGSDGSRHTSDGTAIAAALPLTTSALTLVEDNTDGALWSWGVAYDPAPATVLMQENGSTNNRIKTARWRSGAWQVDQVLASVGGQLGINKYASGVGIDHSDPDTLYIARKIGTHWEMYRYVSANDGSTWTGTALTEGSEVDHVWADTPHFAGAGLSAIWLSGSYTDDSTYSFGISGAE